MSEEFPMWNLSQPDSHQIGGICGQYLLASRWQFQIYWLLFLGAVMLLVFTDRLLLLENGSIQDVTIGNLSHSLIRIHLNINILYVCFCHTIAQHLRFLLFITSCPHLFVFLSLAYSPHINQEAIDIFEGVRDDQALGMAANLGFKGALQRQVMGPHARL